MSLPEPAAVMRHRPPALCLGSLEAADERALRATGVDAGGWPWPRLLEGTAQAAGLLAGLQPDGPRGGAVIAEYRDVVVHVEHHDGPVRFEAVLERRVLGFWRCRCTASGADAAPLLAATVTLAAAPR